MARSRKEKKDPQKISDFEDSCKKGLLYEKIEGYLNECRGETQNGIKSRFPNIAGFCRYCGIGQRELLRLSETYPKEYDALYSIFEDEALNYEDISVNLLGNYLWNRLGYGAKTAEKKESADNDGEAPIAVFEHDIWEDGA